MKIPNLLFCSLDVEKNINYYRSDSVQNVGFLGGIHSPKITIDNTGQKGTLQSGAATLTISNFVIGSGNNRLILLFLYQTNGTTTPTTVAYGAQNFTLATSYTESNGNFGNPVSSKMSVYYLAAPTVSSSTNITVTMPSGSASWNAVAISYFGVNQSSPFGTLVHAYSASSPLSTSSITTSSINSWIITGIAENSSGISTYTLTSPQAIRSGTNFNNGGGFLMALGDAEYATIGSYTPQVSWTGGAGTTSTSLWAVEMIPA